MSQDLRVIKIGGAELAHEPALDRLIGILCQLRNRFSMALVHGGGPEIAALQQRLGLEPCYIDGLRVTDAESLAIAEMVLSGTVNKRLVAHLVAAGMPAVGFSGVDAGLFRANPVSHGQVSLGRVGQIDQVDTSYVSMVLAHGLLPVISPISLGHDGHALNVNADHAALALARALQPKELVFVTDTPGVMRDGQLIAEIDKALAERLISDQVITGGMVPKVHSALEALAAGVQRVRITNLEGLTLDDGTVLRTTKENQGETT